MRPLLHTTDNFHSATVSPKSTTIRSKNAKLCDLSSPWRPSKFHRCKETLNEKGHLIAIKSWLRKALQLKTLNERWARQIVSRWDSWRAIWIPQLWINRYVEWKRCLSRGLTPWINSLHQGSTTDSKTTTSMLKEPRTMHLWHAVINSNRAASPFLGKSMAKTASDKPLLPQITILLQTKVVSACSINSIQGDDLTTLYKPLWVKAQNGNFRALKQPQLLTKISTITIVKESLDCKRLMPEARDLMLWILVLVVSVGKQSGASITIRCPPKDLTIWTWTSRQLGLANSVAPSIQKA